MKARPYGEHAVLVETGERSPARLRELIAGQRGIHEAVPAARTLLVEFDAGLWTVESILQRLDAPLDAPAAQSRHVDIPVRYDGPDLEDVASSTGLSVDDVVARHSGATYTVAFCGFSPGFAYLGGLDPALHVPRLAQPRTSVPAGAVAVAGEYSAVYPRSSPGGWRLLGTTGVVLWDIDDRPPALLAPGTTVRFVAL